MPGTCFNCVSLWSLMGSIINYISWRLSCWVFFFAVVTTLLVFGCSNLFPVLVSSGRANYSPACPDRYGMEERSTGLRGITHLTGEITLNGFVSSHLYLCESHKGMGKQTLAFIYEQVVARRWMHSLISLTVTQYLVLSYPRSSRVFSGNW